MGEKKNGIPHGKGKHLHYGSPWYEWDFVEGRMEGQGKMIDPYDSASYYEGAMKNNVPHGSGKMVYSDGYYHTGNYVNRDRSGSGKLFYEDGSMKYEEAFTDNAITRQGTFYTKQGNKYVGSFENGLMYGPFKHYQNGVLVYEGEMADSYREGTGKLYQNGKLWYEGQVDGYDQTGEGVLYYMDGTYYEGSVYKGKANGEGTLYGKNKEVISTGYYFEDVYQPEPEKLKSSQEYILFTLKKSSGYYVVDGMTYEDDVFEPNQGLISIVIEDQAQYDTYNQLTEAERLAFMNTFAQEHWGDVLGVEESFVVVEFEGETVEGTVTSYEQTSEMLKLVKSPQGIEDFRK